MSIEYSLSYKEYLMNIINKEPQIMNGWGWFVDIETNISFPNRTKIKSSHQVSTIRSIRSRQSMKNLCELNKEEPSFILTLLLHSIGFISCVFCYFIVKS